MAEVRDVKLLVDDKPDVAQRASMETSSTIGAREGVEEIEEESEPGAPKGSLDYSTNIALLVDVDVKPSDRDYAGGYGNCFSPECKKIQDMWREQVFVALGNCDLDLLDQLRAKDKGLINRQYVWGWTLAHFAAATGMFEVLEWIALYDKAALGLPNACGQTAMHYAAANGQIDALLILIDESRTSMDATCSQGERPLDVARRGRCRQALEGEEKKRTGSTASDVHLRSLLASAAGQKAKETSATCACFGGIFGAKSSKQDTTPIMPPKMEVKPEASSPKKQALAAPESPVELRREPSVRERIASIRERSVHGQSSRELLPSMRERLHSERERMPSDHASDDGGRQLFMAGGRERFHSGRGSLPAETIF